MGIISGTGIQTLITEAGITTTTTTSVNPQITVTPGGGTLNTFFHVDGAGFTAGGQVKLGPVAFPYTFNSIIVTAGSDGTATDRNFNPPNIFNVPPGNYSFLAQDLTTGKQSNRPGVTVTPPRVSTNLTTGTVSTVFILTGDDFCGRCSGNTATIHRVGPGGSDLVINGVAINGNRGFVTSGFTLTVGTWDISAYVVRSGGGVTSPRRQEAPFDEPGERRLQVAQKARRFCRPTRLMSIGRGNHSSDQTS